MGKRSSGRRPSFSAPHRPRALALALALCAAGRSSAFVLLRGPGEAPTTVEGVLGTARRWPAPYRFGDARGLGGGISYALDSRFCDVMLAQFNEESYIDNFLTLGRFVRSTCAAAARKAASPASPGGARARLLRVWRGWCSAGASVWDRAHISVRHRRAPCSNRHAAPAPRRPPARSHARCDELEETIANAFDSWAANHPHISFKRDTSGCAGERDCASTGRRAAARAAARARRERARAHRAARPVPALTTTP